MPIGQLEKGRPRVIAPQTVGELELVRRIGLQFSTAMNGWNDATCGMGIHVLR
jgi:hypothetical protein